MNQGAESDFFSIVRVINIAYRGRPNVIFWFRPKPKPTGKLKLTFGQNRSRKINETFGRNRSRRICNPYVYRSRNSFRLSPATFVIDYRFYNLYYYSCCCRQNRHRQRLYPIPRRGYQITAILLVVMVVVLSSSCLRLCHNWHHHQRSIKHYVALLLLAIRFISGIAR